MQTRKRWQLFLILIVVALTIYNILPTVFYYSKPLKSDISQKQSENISKSIAKRVNSLENDSIDWLLSFCKMMKISPANIAIEKDNPQLIKLNFDKTQDAQTFRKFIPKAGALIPFVPAQLSLSYQDKDSDPKEVLIQRQIPIEFNLENIPSYFEFTKKTENNQLSGEYSKILFDRAAQIGLAVGGPSESSLLITNAVDNPENPASEDILISLATDIVEITKVFGEKSPISKRFYANFSQNNASSSSLINSLISSVENFKNKVRLERIALQKTKAEAKEKQGFVDEDINQKISLIENKENILSSAERIIKDNKNSFISKQKPFSYEFLYNKILETYKNDTQATIIPINVNLNNPLISQIIIDTANDKVFLHLHNDVIEFKNEVSKKKKDQLEQVIINEIAQLTRLSDENILPHANEYVISLNSLSNSSSMLVLKLEEIAKIQSQQIKTVLSNNWNPKHPELSNEAFPIYDFKTYQSLPEQQKKICLVIYAPVFHTSEPIQGMRNNSIYVIAKGLDRIISKYNQNQDSPIAKQFMEDFQQLQLLLRQNGYLGYAGSSLSTTSGFHNDYVFERNDYYQMLLASTREQFKVHGSKKYSTLEFTNLEQRILTLNKIETQMHEDLLKWKDDYQAAQVSIYPYSKYEVPPPTKNVLFNNFALSFKKYFRGDDRKILHWGLDLSGGKTVQIELRDQNNQLVKNESDIKQGINELYNRVNKMGVSEVNIRSVDNNIVLDFPGSQGLSASELIKASTMYFHVVNEKFTPNNRNLADHVQRFLQEVWNEAVVTNKKDIESINNIAYSHLYGESIGENYVQPRSESAKILYQNGLRLAPLFDTKSTSIFNDSLSKIAMFRGSNFSEWEGQTHPLIIVFYNYALEGSNLANVRAEYDPSKGNYISFEVRGSYTKKDGQKINPRDDLFDWTSHFSKDKVSGTSLEEFSKAKGWRMSVILNDSIISAPTLEASIRDRAMISGRFSQREVNQLVADLKAGSLTFTPKILSEKNVSPELGKQERTKGIVATAVSLALVILAMITYYRFSGVVASIAVLFNLFIMWATLQNIQATLTLAGIAGIILTVGMAVDANVLVFERIKEEFKISKRLVSAIQIGYRKAFSAIFDSNITTIIAAIILLNFDAGPIKGFAITLIIGIISSMFSALFMTRYFFTGWVKNPKHTELKMCDFIKTSKFNFLKNSKYAITLSLIIILTGSYMLINQRHNIFGMDFTGGFSLNLELKENETIDYRTAVEKAFVKAGATSKDIQIRELNPSNNIRVLLGTAMEQEGQPFYKLPLEEDNKDITYAYENNPRISWIVTALKNQGLELKERSLMQLDSSWTVMSGQMSDSMRNNALWGLMLAFIAIFIYITFRFEFTYAASAIICLIHDVVISLGTIALLRAINVPVQIDLHTVAALMTIIGYSLNDTIIIFDRIREDIKHMKKQSLSEVVNHALNITLSRTTITSGTTLLALIGLVVLGGPTIFNFALVMTLGVVFGTLSSLFIASPLMLFFHKWELKKEEKIALNEK